MSYIILISPLLLIAVVAWLAATAVAAGYGRLARDMAAAGQQSPSDGTAEKRPSLSVVVTTNNQADALRRNLPLLLDQDYPDFEVIVADTASADDTCDVLEALEYEHTNLRHTKTPASARDISLERLALILGLRTARGEWVVVVTADTRPASSQWLRAVAQETAEWRTLLIGSVRYPDDAPLRLRFERLWATITTANHILSQRAPLLATPANVALRREAFIGHNGITARDHDLRHGTLELLVNSVNKPRATAYIPGSGSVLIQDTPADTAAWRQQAVVQMETRRHARHIVRMAAANIVRLLMPWLVMAAIGLPMTLSIIAATYAYEQQPLPQYIIDMGHPAATDAAQSPTTLVAAALTATLLAVMLIAYVWVKLRAVRRTSLALGSRPIMLPFLWYELLRPFAVARIWWRWLRTSHNDFRKRFV